MDGLKVQRNAFMPPGTQALVRDGEVVCVCEVGAPIEDAVADTVVMHPADIERLSTDVAGSGRRDGMGKGGALLTAAAFSLALLSGMALAFADDRPQAQPKFDLEDTRAAIDSFFIASVVLKARCREMTDRSDACLAKGEIAMLERVREVCEEANVGQELCGEIADAKRY